VVDLIDDFVSTTHQPTDAGERRISSRYRP
jgi:hypothetical protein